MDDSREAAQSLKNSAIDEKPKPKNRYWTWQKTERLLLIITTICSLSVSYYSVETSRIAIQQSKIGLRPWLAIKGQDMRFDSDRITTRFIVENIGELPAYLKFKVTGFIDQVALTNQTFPENPFIMMPKQTMYLDGLTIKGKSIEKIKNKTLTEKLEQSIEILYGAERNKLDLYWTKQRTFFDVKDLPDDLNDINNPGIWNIISAEIR